MFLLYLFLSHLDSIESVWFSPVQSIEAFLNRNRTELSDFFFIFNRFIQFFLSVYFFKLIFSQFFWFNRLIGFF
jgi:hypothetical protein